MIHTQNDTHLNLNNILQMVFPIRPGLSDGSGGPGHRCPSVFQSTHPRALSVSNRLQGKFHPQFTVEFIVSYQGSSMAGPRRNSHKACTTIQSSTRPDLVTSGNTGWRVAESDVRRRGFPVLGLRVWFLQLLLVHVARLDGSDWQLHCANISHRTIFSV